MKSRAQKLIEDIAKSGPPETRQDFRRLVAMLGEDDYQVRQVAVEMMGHSMKKAFVPRLVQTLQDPHHRVRMAAAQALGWIRDPRAIPYLVHTALYDPDSDVSLSAILGLQWIRDIHAVPGLFQITGQHLDPVVRKAALAALLPFGDKLEPFLQRIIRDGRRAHRLIAEEVLKRLNERESDSSPAVNARPAPRLYYEETRVHLPAVPDEELDDTDRH